MLATRILIALEPGRVSPEAIELGHALAVATGAPIGLLAVWRWWEPVELAMAAGEDTLRDEAHKVLRAGGRRLRDRGHDDVAAHLRAATSVDSALHEAAEEGTTGLLILGPAHRGATAHAGDDVDLLVCGSRSYGPLGALLFGSVSRPLLHRASTPLLVVPRGRERRLEQLLADPEEEVT